MASFMLKHHYTCAMTKLNAGDASAFMCNDMKVTYILSSTPTLAGNPVGPTLAESSARFINASDLLRPDKPIGATVAGRMDAQGHFEAFAPPPGATNLLLFEATPNELILPLVNERGEPILPEDGSHYVITLRSQGLNPTQPPTHAISGELLNRFGGTQPPPSAAGLLVKPGHKKKVACSHSRMPYPFSARRRRRAAWPHALPSREPAWDGSLLTDWRTHCRDERLVHAPAAIPCHTNPRRR